MRCIIDQEIELKLVLMGDYLILDEDTKFVIPEYQRKHSWGISHCDKLWSDVIDFIDSDRKDSYFFE